MKKMFSLILALLMCWSVLYGILPVREVSAVDTGTAAIAGERYTCDWVIPEIGSNSVVTGAPGTSSSKVENLSYEILGYVSPKYADDHAVTGDMELIDGEKASRHFLNDGWVGLYGDEANGIVVDLGAHYTNLSTVTLYMLSSPENGIYLPTNITVASSANREDYNKVFDNDNINMKPVEGVGTEGKYYVPTEYTSVLYELTIDANTLFNGSYLLIKFDHDVAAGSFKRYWTFISEIEVTTSGNAIMPNHSGASEMNTHDLPTGETFNVNAALMTDYQIIGTTGSDLHSDAKRNKLADGVLGGTDYNTDANYVNITATDGKAAIQFDLGLQQQNISSFELKGYYSASLSGVNVPQSIEVYASEDGVTYYKVLLASNGGYSSSPNGKYTYSVSVNGDKAFSARYITLVITTSSADGVLILDEVVINNVKASAVMENRALNATYKYLSKTVSSDVNDDVWAGGYNDNGVPVLNTYSKGDLNNGIYATGSFLDPAWVSYNFSSSLSSYVDLVFDLGEEYGDLQQVSFKLLDYTASTTSSACSVPESFTVFYANSEDAFKESRSVTGGISKKVEINTDPSNKETYVYYTATLNSVTARYIMLRINKEKNRLFLDEVEIWSGNQPQAGSARGDHVITNYGFDDATLMSAIWLSYLDIKPLTTLNGVYQVDEQTYRARVNNYLSAMKGSGINTLFVHAMAFGDRLYGSIEDDEKSVLPYSVYYTGSVTTKSTYDAFEILVDAAHDNGFSVHAWLNPMRLTTQSNINSYDSKYAAKQFVNGSYNGVEHSDYAGLVSNYYWLNPAYESVRDFIVSCLNEILDKYDVDGVVIDDYFYPEGATTAFDSESYELYGGDLSLGDFRRSNATALVQQLYDAVKAKDPDLKFGISPQGSSPDPFETSGNYTTMYADIRSWVKEGYMDYLSPQMYWDNDACFAYVASSKRGKNYLDGWLADWAAIAQTNTSVKLIPSLGLYKAMESENNTDYKNTNVILTQLTFMYDKMYSNTPYSHDTEQEIAKIHGVALFRSANLYDDYSSPEGWHTDGYFTAQYNNDIRWYLKTNYNK